MFMIQRPRVFLLALLPRPQALQIFAESGHLAFQLLQCSGRAFHRTLLDLHFARELAQFALECQRTAARLLSSTYRVAVITYALRQQEEELRMPHRQPLRSRAI